MGLIGDIAGENVENAYNSVTPDINNPAEIVQYVGNPVGATTNEIVENLNPLPNQTDPQDPDYVDSGDQDAVDTILDNGSGPLIPGIGGGGSDTGGSGSTGGGGGGSDGIPQNATPDLSQNLQDLINPMPGFLPGTDGSGGGNTGGTGGAGGIGNVIPNPLAGVNQLLGNLTKITAVAGALILGYLIIER